MGKSSASLKRKRSKNSSKAKESSKSKSRKYKSKKIRHREVSPSISDYDDSKNLDTLASSSSEDNNRRKRDRSRTRKDVKGRKKKARRRSYSSDSSEDSLHARKRKKGKRKRENEVREKHHRKKKIRREPNDSLTSSGSQSCSTCQGGSASSDANQYESRRGRPEGKEKGKRRSERGRSGSASSDANQYESRRGRSEGKEEGKRRSKRGRSGSERSSRYRARSCSPCSPCSESSHEGAEGKYIINENNSGRLRSVITVAKVAEESVEFCRYEAKEEIVDDHDYPCRSNDSNDGGTKRELDTRTILASEEKLGVEDEMGDANADSAETGETIKKTGETSWSNLNAEDLESILRQRALENLRKFRGVIQSNAKASDQKNKIVSQVKQPVTDKHELVQGKSLINNAAVGSNFDRQTRKETSFPVGRKNITAYPRKNESLNMDEDISGSGKHHLACAPEKATDAANLSETVTESTNHRTKNPELAMPEYFHDSVQSHPPLKQTLVPGPPQEKQVVAESSEDRVSFEAFQDRNQSGNRIVDNTRGLPSSAPKPSSIHGPDIGRNNLDKGQYEVKEHSQFELKQTSASHGPANTKFPVAEGDVERNAVNTTQAALQDVVNNGRDVDELSNSTTPKSCIESTSVENNSGKVQDESNQGSQFEQKTMNVMRGGEMVQVSYKVYIPKKTPALGRRQLKR